MLDFLAYGLPRRPRRTKGLRDTKQTGWFARLAERLLIRMDVGSDKRPASLYLSSVDLMPMGTWVVVAEDKQTDSGTTSDRW